MAPFGQCSRIDGLLEKMPGDLVRDQIKWLMGVQDLVKAEAKQLCLFRCGRSGFHGFAGFCRAVEQIPVIRLRK